MNKLKTAGKWALYLIGAVISYLIFDSLSEVRQFLVIFCAVGWYAYYSHAKQRQEDMLRHQSVTANLHDLISSQGYDIWSLRDRINKLEEGRCADSSVAASTPNLKIMEGL